MWIICGILSLGFALWNGITIFQTGKSIRAADDQRLVFCCSYGFGGLSSDRLVDRPRRLGGTVECDADDDRLVCRIRRLVMIVCNGVPWVLRYRKLIMTHIEK